ncbi:MAG TPA: hypothetical protein VFY14_21820, partial [Streptomyces sp.]|nr:hypothetical protein [Streptomyces sp.]
MSDDQQERPDEPFVDHRLFLINVQRSGGFFPFSPGAAARARARVTGSTNFEGKDLEDMLAMVENANPSDLESAADDLWQAAGKIKEIGDDLKTHVDKVAWEGEFGESFRAWGRNLSKNTLLLADYTEQASVNLKTAGVGLATVKNGMPKRNASYAGIPRPENIPTVEQVETNEKFKLAKKKEEDRQEAINQMNRLASYYRVSRENMQAKEEPQFGPMPKIGMPPPPPRDPGSPFTGTSTSTSGVGTVSTPLHGEGSERTAQSMPPGVAVSAPVASDGGIVPQHGQREVRTDLNTVAPPVAPPTDSGPRVQPPVSGPAVSGPGPVAPPPAYSSPGNRLGRVPGGTSGPAVPGVRGGGGGRAGG